MLYLLKKKLIFFLFGESIIKTILIHKDFNNLMEYKNLTQELIVRCIKPFTTVGLDIIRTTRFGTTCITKDYDFFVVVPASKGFKVLGSKLFDDRHNDKFTELMKIDPAILESGLTSDNKVYKHGEFTITVKSDMLFEKQLHLLCDKFQPVLYNNIKTTCAQICVVLPGCNKFCCPYKISNGKGVDEPDYKTLFTNAINPAFEIFLDKIVNKENIHLVYEMMSQWTFCAYNNNCNLYQSLEKIKKTYNFISVDHSYPSDLNIGADRGNVSIYALPSSEMNPTNDPLLEPFWEALSKQITPFAHSGVKSAFFEFCVDKEKNIERPVQLIIHNISDSIDKNGFISSFFDEKKYVVRDHVIIHVTVNALKSILMTQCLMNNLNPTSIFV
jgi:hypothetical protein